MNLDEARETIRDLARFGYIYFSPHCKDRMLLRNISAADISHVLCWGEIDYGKEKGDDKNLVFRISGFDSEGESLIVVAQIDSNVLRCRTVWGD
jgi:hypothetical protein